jgi:hypothetical protein
VNLVITEDTTSSITRYLDFSSGGLGSSGVSYNPNFSVVVSTGTLSAPTFSGGSITQSPGDNSTNIATTAYVDAAVSGGSGVAVVKQQTFTASGTYTPSAGLLYATIECVGGGAAGGGSFGTTGGAIVGAGGGSGGYSRKMASAASIGASQTVTIGAGGTGVSNGTGNAGGDTSVGTLCIGKGGSGGAAGVTSLGGRSAGGAGGIAGTGDYTAAGAHGGDACSSTITSVSLLSGTGGSSFFGGGAGGASVNQVGAHVPGYAGAANTGGGSGAAAVGSTSNDTGGAGGSGVVIITEYCS